MRPAALDPWRLAPVALAAAGAVAYLVFQPPSADLAAHVYRAGLFSREGFALWDGQWYAGHHVPGYSVLFPPVAAALGPRLAGALSAVATAAIFAALARDHFGRGAELGGAWLGLATVTLLLTGRLAFALGLAIGLGALLALQRGRLGAGLTLAVACSLASPVAGLFLALAGAALVARTPRRDGAALTLVALAPIAALAVAFPEGGTEPFVLSAFSPVALITAGLLAALPPRERVLRAGLVLYGLATLGAFLLATPVGGNVARLGALFAGPLAACALWESRRALLALAALPLLAFQVAPAIRAVADVHGDRAVREDYYAPLLAFLARQPGPPARLEIPFTKSHWEAAWVAPHVALARGWERQLDRDRNALFYRPGPLAPATYRAWLRALAVRWVALPDAPLDASARAEAELVRTRPPWLREAWRGDHWRVWEVRGAAPFTRGAATVTRLASDEVDLDVRARGPVAVQVRFTPYWTLAAGAGCVRPTPGGWTAIDARAPGRFRLVTRFSIGRIGARSSRCD